MKKIIFFLAAATLMCSCANKTKEFVDNFSKAVTSNDKQALEALYPDVALLDSISLQCNPDSVIINTEGEKPVITMGNVTLVLTENAEGNLVVESSKGLLALDSAKFAFAKGTGWFDEKLTDKENAVNLKDTCFANTLFNQVLDQLKKM